MSARSPSAVTPWPHQVRAFHRLYDNWPPKLLIADEVGLGKTVQAGFWCGRHGWRGGRTHPDPRAESGVPAVADRASREVQSQLADLRRPEAQLVSVAGHATADMSESCRGTVAPRTSRHRVQPSGAPRRPAAGATGGRRTVGPRDPRRSASRPSSRRWVGQRGRSECVAAVDAEPRGTGRRGWCC